MLNRLRDLLNLDCITVSGRTLGQELEGALVPFDGTTIDCGPAGEPGWFAATVGGMGLTGVITEAELQLRRVAGPWLVTDTVPYRNLDEFFALADGSGAAATSSRIRAW